LKQHERAEHLCKCPSAARSNLLDKLVDDIIRWMSTDDSTTNPELLYLLPKYIRSRGSLSFTELGPMSSQMALLAASQDLIGWRNFMEGRLSSHFFTIQQNHLLSGMIQMNASDWVKKLVTKILHMTNAQWGLLWNFMLHNHTTGFLMVKHRVQLILKLDHLSRTQLHEEPGESKFLLEIDTNTLAGRNKIRHIGSAQWRRRCSLGRLLTLLADSATSAPWCWRSLYSPQRDTPEVGDCNWPRPRRIWYKCQGFMDISSTI
jgi:hypothetical protein